MNKSLRLSILIVSLLLAKFSFAQVPHILSFEGNQQLFASRHHSSLSLTKNIYKFGTQSLQWSWENDSAQIVLHHPIGWAPDPIGFKDPTTFAFIFWVHQAGMPAVGTLRFEFMKRGELCSWFDYKLGFTGWRSMKVSYSHDMQGTPQPDMDELRIRVEGIKQGSLSFDLIIPNAPIDIRSRIPDLQATFVRRLKKGERSGLVAWEQNIDIEQHPLTTSERQDMQIIEDRFCDFYLQGRKAHELESLKERFDRYKIEVHPDRSISGLPIYIIGTSRSYFSRESSPIKSQFEKNTADFNATLRLLLSMSETYNLSTDSTTKQETEKMFVLLTKHLLEQGFIYGSSMGSIGNTWYNGRELYPAMLLMKQSLMDAGLDETVRKTMEWYSNASEVKTIPPQFTSMDDLNTLSMGRLAAVLMMRNTPEKVAYLKGYSRWITLAFESSSPGLGSGFKIDNTAYHHCNNYPAYARDGLRGSVESVSMISQGQFAITPKAYNRFKQILLTMRFYCNLRNWPIAMSGRHPSGWEGLMPSQFSMLALALPNKKIDKELAEAYMRLMADKTEDPYYRLFEAKGFTPEAAPNGIQTLPYACALTQRRGNWAATVRATSRYLWGSETYEGANLYGRYLGFGPLQIVASGSPISNEQSGYHQPGWDWNHWWGVTATVLPIDRLRADIRNADTSSGYEEMLFSDQAFAGPVSIEGKNGAFGYLLHEHDKYNGSLRGRKSYFFFDNRIVCLGSNIRSDISTTPTETTLFQEHIPNQGNAVWLNGTAINAPSYHAARQKNTHIVDAQGNSYFIPKGEVYLRRGKQKSFHEETDASTEGDFSVAAISHGNAPRSGTYEYAIVVGDNNRRAPRYEVIRRDSSAHIVADAASATVGYAVFEPGTVEPNRRILHTTIPVMIMLSQKTAKHWVLSVADPDLRLYEGPSDDTFDTQGKRIERSIYSRPWNTNISGISHPRITLKGNWKIATPIEQCRIVSSNTHETIIEFTCQHGLTNEVQLTANQ